MNYSEITKALDGATGFDLFRLHAAIGRMLDDPQRVVEVKRAVWVGQEIEYFDVDSNRPLMGRLVEFRRTRVVIQNLHDGKRWLVPYYVINIHKVETAISSSAHKAGMDRNELGVGDWVGFVDRDQQEQYGRVLRLNQKTVTLQGQQLQWWVSYSLLFKVLAPDVTALPSD